jgi:GNAT superfamily N-acetyltransferase
MYNIRRADREDAPGVAQLAHDPGSTIDVESVDVGLDLLGPEDGAVFVADTGKQLAGWINTYRSHVLQTEPSGQVGGLVVDPHNRGTGVGRRLLEAAERSAAATISRPSASGATSSGRLRIFPTSDEATTSKRRPLPSSSA